MLNWWNRYKKRLELNKRWRKKSINKVSMNEMIEKRIKFEGMLWTLRNCYR